MIMNPREIVSDWIDEASKEKTVGAIYVDIDHMQAHNCEYGHIVGDESIFKISNAISIVLCDIKSEMIRISGDEFIVILSGKEAEKTFEIADTILAAVNQLPVKHSSQRETVRTRAMPERLTISLGAIIDNSSNKQLVAMSDASCYLAKSAGRDRVMKLDFRQPSSVVNY